MKPYLVEKICNIDGEMVYERKPEIVRQVISRSTAAKVTWLMENVAIRGSADECGYRGISHRRQNRDGPESRPGGGYIPGEYIVSLIGFLPAEDPQIVLYVAVDGATRGVQWGLPDRRPHI